MWECLDAVDEAGNSASEDLAGTAGRMAWVLDGASSVFPVRDKVTEEDSSDARWLVKRIAKHLEGLAGEKAPLPSVVAQAIQRTAGDARREWARQDVDVPPSAALGVVRQVGTRTEYLVLADVSLVFRTAEGLVEVIDHRVDEVNEPARLAMAEALASPEATFATAIAHTRPFLADARRTGMNRDGGYWVASVDKAAVEHAVVGSVEGVQEIVLASDGFMRAVHLFGEFTLEDLFTTPLPAIAAAVRERELLDPDTRAFPRWSVRDDICARRLVWHD